MIYDVRSRWFRQFLTSANTTWTKIKVPINPNTTSNQPAVPIGPTGSA